jgi:hypothetical protein
LGTGLKKNNYISVCSVNCEKGQENFNKEKLKLNTHKNVKASGVIFTRSVLVEHHQTTLSFERPEESKLSQVTDLDSE